MLREALLLLLGLALLAGALYLVHIKVIAIQIGAHSSRLVGVLCAIVAYYYLRPGLLLGMPHGPWTVPRLMALGKLWLPPLLLGGMAVYYAITMLRQWRAEFINLIASTVWIGLVVALVVAARYILIQ